MEYLETHQSITLKEFTEIAQISSKMASKTLILLVLAGVLSIKPNEFSDVFERKME